MGYRYHEPDLVEDSGFSTQFEWQGSQLLFRRNQREPPVQVRADERDRAIDNYETRMRHGRIGTAIAAAVGIIAVMLTKGTGNASESLALFAIPMASMLFLKLVDHHVARSVTSAFNHRTPVGPSRSRLELRQARVADQTFGTLLSGGAFAMLAILGPWPPHGVWAWFAIAVGATGAFMAIFDIGLRLLQKRA